MIVESLLADIDRGREGFVQGLSMGMPKLESVIDGVIQSNYTVILSHSSTGKTSFALYSYVYKPIMDTLDNDNFKVVYYSLEISAELLMAKLLSLYIFEKYHIEISAKELLSRKKGCILSDEYYDIVKECIPWLQKVEKKLIIFDKGLNAEILYTTLLNTLKQFGTFSESNNRKIYVPNNPRQIINVVIDHISLVQPSNGRTLKQEIDTISAYLVTIRNRCKISPVVLMQANRNSTSMDRRRENLSNLRVEDAKDSACPIQDGDVVITLFSPHRDQLATYHGYDIRQLGDNFRTIGILKNRYGESSLEIASSFYGRCGIFAEIPKPDEIYDYSKYQSIDWLINSDVEETTNGLNFKF